jgi:hypothetical protein
MLQPRNKHPRGIRKRTAAVAATALMLPVIALVSASPAAAEPMGIFKIFAQCPTEKWEETGVALCSYAQTTSGEFVLGSTKVPIEKTITLQGGFIPTGNPENEREFYGVGAKDGETLSKTELNVPGGLTEFVKCEDITGGGLVEIAARALCKTVFENGLTGVTSTTELVTTKTNPLLFNEQALGAEEGTALTLPLRVHIKNPLLGNSCYIGSTSDPLELHLTTGETAPPAGFTPIHGALGKPETLKEYGLRVLRVSGNQLVDNTFPAPAAEGCGELLGITGFLDSIVNGKLKLPNKAGENVAKLDGELNAATPEHVIESESFPPAP